MLDCLDFLLIDKENCLNSKRTLEERVEASLKLLKLVGNSFDSEIESCIRMNKYFSILDLVINETRNEFSTRIKFLTKDLIELRKVIFFKPQY